VGEDEKQKGGGKGTTERAPVSLTRDRAGSKGHDLFSLGFGP
jgi:hypothetical protein